MLPNPNFPVRPDEFVGRRQQIEEFRRALQQGLLTGRTSSFAVLGDWGIGKSNLLLKFAAVCTEPEFAMLPVFVSVSKDIHDYLRLAESLLDKFADGLTTAPNIRTRLQELRNWRFKRVSLGGFDLVRESRPLFLSSGTSLLRHTLKEAWDRFLQTARLNGAILFLDDLQNITSISKGDLALAIRDQFQSLGIEGMNYSVCFSAKSDYFAETKALAEPAVRFYTKLHLVPFTREETCEYTRSVFADSPETPERLATWLHEKTLGRPYFLAFVCRELSVSPSSVQPQKLEQVWPSIFEQLGREKFRSDVFQLSKELELLHQIAKTGDGQFAVHQFGSKFQTEYFGRLAEKGLIIRTRRGRYKLYHPLFREFLQRRAK